MSKNNIINIGKRMPQKIGFQNCPKSEIGVQISIKELFENINNGKIEDTKNPPVMEYFWMLFFCSI
jgi:hypothetical protein